MLRLPIERSEVRACVINDLTYTPDNERRISEAEKSTKKALEVKGKKACSRSTSFKSNNFASINNFFRTCTFFY